MFEPANKLCPLFSVGQPRPVPCKGSGCALFLAKQDGAGTTTECALTCLAKQISIIARR